MLSTFVGKEGREETKLSDGVKIVPWKHVRCNTNCGTLLMTSNCIVRSYCVGKKKEMGIMETNPCDIRLYSFYIRDYQIIILKGSSLKRKFIRNTDSYGKLQSRRIF